MRWVYLAYIVIVAYAIISYFILDFHYTHAWFPLYILMFSHFLAWVSIVTERK